MSRKLGSLNKIFSADKVVDNWLFNLIGVQVFRTIAARLVYNSRPVRTSGTLEDKIQKLQREGMLVWPNFLPAEQFETLKRECVDALRSENGFKSRRSGRNIDARIAVRNIDVSSIPTLRGLLVDRRLQGILEAAERRVVGDLAAIAKIEHLTQGSEAESQDPQTQLHSDIFFTSHKAWFYITDVTAKDGPLVFVKGSHHLTPRQLFYVYTHSCFRAPSEDRSRRISAEELNKMGFGETILTCSRNTLVVANTCGYHRRLQGEAGRERLSVHLELRTDPFRLSPSAHGKHSTIAAMTA